MFRSPAARRAFFEHLKQKQQGGALLPLALTPHIPTLPGPNIPQVGLPMTPQVIKPTIPQNSAFARIKRILKYKG